MSDAPQVVKSYCCDCGRDTNHLVLKEIHESGDTEYACDLFHQILMCNGCDSKSFRKAFYDTENAFPDHDGKWEVPEDITNYPKAIKGHHEMPGMHVVPEIVCRIYEEV